MKTYLILFIRTSVLMLVIFSCTKEIVTNDTDLTTVSNVQSDREIITLKSGVEVEKRGDLYILGGDIVLTNEQLKSLDELGGIFFSENNEPIDTVNAVLMPVISGMKYYFPNHTASDNNQVYNDIRTKAFGHYPTTVNSWSMVRYTLDPNLDYSKCLEINAAIAHIEANTNVRFYNATGEPTIFGGVLCSWVNFRDGGNVMNSYVGRIGGKQDINIAWWALYGNIMHEICHAVGLRHEHQRFDRDTYIDVNTSNIQSEYLSDFSKITSNYFAVGSFDFNSITLYSSDACAIDPNIYVMKRKDTGGGFIGQRTYLSTLDRSWINGIYIPYIARPDTWFDLAPTVYKSDNTVMNSLERENFIKSLNGGSLPPPIPSYQVTFNLNGAPGTPPSSQSVVWNNYATAPSDPQRTDYAFGGWYTTSACNGSPINFATYKITSNQTLYAKWTTTGIDVTVYNNSAIYDLNETDIVLTGKVGSTSIQFISTNTGTIYKGGVSSKKTGKNFTPSPGTGITNLSLNFIAFTTYGVSKQATITAVIDGGTGSVSKSVSIGPLTIYAIDVNLNPSSTTVPSSGRRELKIYVDVW